MAESEKSDLLAPVLPEKTEVRVNGGIMIYANGGRMEEIMRKINSFARTDSSVLLIGKTGVGKENLAHYIHEHSLRRQKPYVVINCGARDASLIEDELFGHVKGAYTGADKDRKGRFEEAEGGTIFLDELDKMPRPLQAKLLRVLENKTFSKIGSNAEMTTNVRVIAAVNHLSRMETKGGKREPVLIPDLYHRLSQFEVRVPPLHERPEDILPLATHFIEKKTMEYGFDHPPRVTEEALTALQAHKWFGNIRELSNVMGRATLYAGDGGAITSEHLELRRPKVVFTGKRGKVDIGSLLTRNNQVSNSQIARDSGLNRNTITKLLRNYACGGQTSDNVEALLGYMYRRDGEEGARQYLEALLQRVIEQEKQRPSRAIG